jgi:hypothetical protein
LQEDQLLNTENSDSTNEKGRFAFKITVVGPDDDLVMDVLRVLNEQVISLDGIRISSAQVETDDSDVRMLLMSPRHSALDVLLGVTFRGASAALIVMPEEDSDIESVYRKEIEEEIGEGTPVKVIICESSCVDDFKRNEIAYALDELVGRLLESRNHTIDEN